MVYKKLGHFDDPSDIECFVGKSAEVVASYFMDEEGLFFRCKDGDLIEVKDENDAASRGFQFAVNRRYVISGIPTREQYDRAEAEGLLLPSEGKCPFRVDVYVLDYAVHKITAGRQFYGLVTWPESQRLFGEEGVIPTTFREGQDISLDQSCMAPVDGPGEGGSILDLYVLVDWPESQDWDFRKEAVHGFENEVFVTVGDLEKEKARKDALDGILESLDTMDLEDAVRSASAIEARISGRIAREAAAMMRKSGIGDIDVVFFPELNGGSVFPGMDIDDISKMANNPDDLVVKCSDENGDNRKNLVLSSLPVMNAMQIFEIVMKVVKGLENGKYVIEDNELMCGN